MKINPNFILKKTENLVKQVISVTPENYLPREYYNIKTNKLFGNIMIDDFGDYLPFVYWLSKFSDKKFSAWSENIFNIGIEKFQMPSGLLCTNFNHKKVKYPRKSNFRFFNADKMSDAVLGINLLYQLKKKNKYLEANKKFFKGLIKYFVSKEGYVNYLSFPVFNIKFPLSSGKWSGLYIEELTRLYEFTKGEKYLKFAWKLAFPWLNNNFFKKNKLFPFVCTNKFFCPLISFFFKARYSYSLNSAMMTKSNVNLIFGLTRLYNVTKNKKLKEDLKNWVIGVEKIVNNFGVLQVIWPSKKKIIFLGSDHAVIDALLGIYLSTKNKKAFKLAFSIANSWLKYQSKEGLMPQGIKTHKTSFHEKKNVQHYLSKLDIQTDFATVLIKLYELSKNKKYLTSALRIIEGIEKYHKYNKTYANFYDLEIKKITTYITETKFLFLLTRLYLLVYELSKGKKIYTDSLLKDLIRDR